MLCDLSVCVCISALGVSGGASVGLQGQLALKVFNNALQALPSFPLLQKLLPQLLAISFRLLQLHVQLLDLHHTTRDTVSVNLSQRDEDDYKVDGGENEMCCGHLT